MKKIFLILIVVAVLAAIFFIIFRIGGEDSWIKDSRGVWIKHGNPSEIPDYVAEQQTAIDCAVNIYNLDNSEKVIFESQCLGTCGNYAVDIVHVPRISDDNKQENQCENFRNGQVSHFIELDKNGEIIRIG
jgi:hypothetical protein